MYKAKRFPLSCMKPLLCALLCAGFLLACEQSGGASGGAAEAVDSDTSYAIGMFMASQMSGIGFQGQHLDYKAFSQGFEAFNEAKETRLTPDEMIEKVRALYTVLQTQNQEEMRILGEKNREEGAAYLAANRERSGVSVTASGLQYEVISEGSGRKPGPEATVRVNYEGTFIDGSVFDSSYERGEPVEFPLNQVIQGWTEGLQLMSEGSTYRFVIPSDIAYGPQGSTAIPPDATLIFKVELLSVLEAAE